jgi:hypothetical protein
MTTMGNGNSLDYGGTIQTFFILKMIALETGGIMSVLGGLSL